MGEDREDSAPRRDRPLNLSSRLLTPLDQQHDHENTSIDFGAILAMAAFSQASETGASIIAKILKELGVTVVLGIVGVPVPEIAEQAITTAYGYLTGRPGVCQVVGGPDLDLICKTPKLVDPPKGGCEEARIDRVVALIKIARAPLVLIGKGAAYAKAEEPIGTFINQTQLTFIPSPMGKGVVPDSHPTNASSARSAALKMADVVLILGARLNWIFHHGEAPKWNPEAKFIQVDISAEETGRNSESAEHSLLGDVGVVATQLLTWLGDWAFDLNSSEYMAKIRQAKEKNEKIASLTAQGPSMPLKYARAFDVMKTTLHNLSQPSEGRICYMAESTNTMDISRSILPLEHPRLRLDAGTYATMGFGLPYAIAASEAYNALTSQVFSGPTKRKKTVAIEDDSAFDFSVMEIETMARMGMDIAIFVINNGGIYFGDSDTAENWQAKHEKTKSGKPGLRSWALGWEVKYQKLAEACGGLGFLVRTPEELEKATLTAYNATVPVIVNVVIQSGKTEKASFGWQVARKKRSRKAHM
ncbi:hypothetical protein HBI50_211650 [Parastagonospora nodorum]|nr:hypothetical protein HBI50_211650 [Parastagonospora nodorum]